MTVYEWFFAAALLVAPFATVRIVSGRWRDSDLPAWVLAAVTFALALLSVIVVGAILG